MTKNILFYLILEPDSSKNFIRNKYIFREFDLKTAFFQPDARIAGSYYVYICREGKFSRLTKSNLFRQRGYFIPHVIF